MPRGDKSAYTEKQKRQARHIEEGYIQRGVPEEEAEKRAWATVNAMSGGGKKSGSGRGKAMNKAPAKKGAAKGGLPQAENHRAPPVVARKNPRGSPRHNARWSSLLTMDVEGWHVTFANHRTAEPATGEAPEIAEEVMETAQQVVRVAALGDVHCTRTSQGVLQPLFQQVNERADIDRWGYRDARL
jgi:plasmid stabilization system protein ParE